MNKKYCMTSKKYTNMFSKSQIWGKQIDASAKLAW